MNKNYYSALLIILFSFLSCKKDKSDPTIPQPPQKIISEWITGTDTFIANQLIYNLDTPKPWSIEGAVYGSASASCFGIRLEDYDANKDSFKADGIFNDSFGYSTEPFPGSPIYVIKSIVNGKTKMTLPPTYCQRYRDAAGHWDSTIVQGVFYLP